MLRFVTLLIIFLGILHSTALVYAQNWVWAKTSIPRYARPVATATDQSGNVVILQDEPLNQISVTKLDSAGNLIYDKLLSQTNNWDPVGLKSIAVDLEGNVYFCGYFYEGQLNFGSFTLQSNYEEYVDDSAYNPFYRGMCDIFIVKLNLSGNVVWAKNIAGPGRSATLNVDDQGNLLLSATLKKDAQYVGAVQNPFNVKAHFVASIDRNTGNVSWMKKVGTGEDRGIDNDAQGNIYTLGETSNNNSYLVRLNPAGNFQWYKQVNVEARALTTDSAGNSYVTGNFKGNVDMANGIYLNTQAARSVMAAKYDANAATLWARAMDNKNPNDFFPESRKWAEAMDLDIDSSGNCYVTGYSMIKVDPSTSSYRADDGFIWKIDTQGGKRWVKFYRPLSTLYPAFFVSAYTTSISSTPQGQQYVTFGIRDANLSWEVDGGLELAPNYFVNYPNPSGNSIIAKFNNTENDREVTLVDVHDAIQCFPCWPWEIWNDFEYRFWNELAGVKKAIYRKAFGGDHQDEVFWKNEETLMLKINEAGLDPGRYQLQIRALLEDGTTTEWADAVSFSVENSNTKVFPNPVKDVLTVQYHAQQSERVRLELLNRFGKIIQSEMRVAEKGDNEWRLEVSDVRIEDNPLTLLLHSREGTQRWTLLHSR